MDVSDIKLLQSIYYILQASVSIRSNLSLPDFRIFLISELRKQGFRIELLDDQFHLYNVERIVNDIDSIVRIVRFPWWQNTPIITTPPQKNLFGNEPMDATRWMRNTVVQETFDRKWIESTMNEPAGDDRPEEK